MENYQRQYPLLAACGLNCGLCPRFHTDGASKCPGCAGEGFFTKHPSCGHLSCARRHGAQYCYECNEYPCGRFDKAVLFDSFITHRNMTADFEKVKAAGLEAYQAELNEKVEILQALLSGYDDGRRKSFFCLAVNLLALRDVKYVLEQLLSQINPDRPIKEKAQAAVGLFQDMAEKRDIMLKLRKKE